MRLLLVEDEIDLLNALDRGLRQEGYAVDTALTGTQAWELATVHDYDLLILDLNLPGIDGLEVCRRLRHDKPELLILMLTARAGPRDRVKGLDLGADDYLIKPFYFEELTARIRALLRRDLRTRAPLILCGDLKLDPAAQMAWQRERLLVLTNKEFGILEYLMRRQGEVVTQEELLEHVWNEDVNVFSGSVRVHISNLRRKLSDDAQNPHYLETLVGQGYRLLDPSMEKREN